ncbi:ABC transporter ATP-binding protein [Caballeronia sp. LZ034LL]|uniref:ABC transporter ATP-binding protein n=1 Tax=Caballeronia sp. LZ034LL TaxID=3038567 RepID=UPI0028597472|nr:ABC transporter ATP-binding protein [Caballeronia sp. LZ034LL]MDR5836042.1 ABC transporter ATP-binding protein [Caballeronia sp. LZ034LL]
MLLEIEHLSVRYRTRRGTLTAVDDVSLSIARGETVGLVGESGCGKSSLGRALVRLIDSDDGAVRLEGVDIARLDARRLLPWRKRMQMVFQDPLSALDPRKTIRKTLSLPLALHGIGTRADRRQRIDALLEQVGLAPHLADRLPHELSGGQRQRANIARALSIDPDIVVCDEPVSALDVSLQAQVLNLLGDLQRQRGMAYLFISHDLAAVGHLADRIAVMYLGQIVEIVPRDKLWREAAHPYTRLLLDSIPSRSMRLSGTNGSASTELPSPYDLPQGCRFRQRCPHAMPICAQTDPVQTVLSTGHAVHCHLYRDGAPVTAAGVASPLIVNA